MATCACKHKSGGGMAKEDSKKDIKQDKAMAKKAVGMHEKQLHGGKMSDLAKLKRGGKVKKYAEGGQIGPDYHTDETLRAETRQRLDEEPYKSRVTTMKKEIADSKEKSARALAPFKMAKGGKAKCMARGGGIETKGKTKGRFV